MWYTLPIYNIEWKEVKKVDLSDKIFDDSLVNEGLIQQYVVTYLGNQRQATAHTKTRGEVTVSGRKLYRQKGTGRARVGDAGSPIRRKGGTVFGPRSNANYSRSMPKKMRLKALFGALTLKAKDNELHGLDGYESKEPKTKEAHNFLAGLGIENKKVLVVMGEKQELLMRSFRNIPGVSLVTATQLNPYALLTHHHVLFVDDAVEQLEKHLLPN